MKRMHILHYIVMLCILHGSYAVASNRISFFIRPLSSNHTITAEKLVAETKLHGRTSYTILEDALSKQTYDGIMATYYGYIATSDFNGEVSFTRKQQKDEIKLLVTQMIEPIIMIGAIVHHWETVPSIPARIYSLERKKDETTQAYYWQTTEEKVPDNRRITLDTIVLFADPSTIVVPTGITLTTKSPHLLLPDLYARKDVHIALNALRVLKIRHFFEPVTSETKKQADIYYSRQW